MNAKANTGEKFSSSVKKKAKYAESSESEDEGNSDGNSDDNSDIDSSDIEMKEDGCHDCKRLQKDEVQEIQKSGSTSRKASGDVKTERFKKKDDKENKS